MVFQHRHNLIHVGIGLVKAGLQGHGLLFLLLEEAENAAFLLLAEGLQLHHQGGQSLTYLAQVLGAHVVQGVFREVGNVLLSGSAVLEHHGGVGEVNFLGKILHHLLLLGGELNLCHGFLRGRSGSGGRGGGRGVQGGIQGEGGGEIGMVVHGTFLLRVIFGCHRRTDSYHPGLPGPASVPVRRCRC